MKLLLVWNSLLIVCLVLLGCAEVAPSGPPQGQADKSSAEKSSQSENRSAAAEPATTANQNAPSKTHAWKDTRVEEYDDRLLLVNDRLRLEFSQGRWTGLWAQGVSENMLAPVEPAEAVDFLIDDVWMIEKHGSHFNQHQVVIDEQLGTVSLELTYDVGPRPRLSYIPPRWRTRTPKAKDSGSRWEFRLTSRYTLFAEQGRIERFATLQRRGSSNIITPSFRRCGGFTFCVPGALVG